MANSGIAAMFGPISSQTAAHVQSMCNAFEIPHLQWNWDARDTRDYYSISLFPHYLTLSRAYRDVIRYWGWERFTVLYEDNDGELFRYHRGILNCMDDGEKNKRHRTRNKMYSRKGRR